MFHIVPNLQNKPFQHIKCTDDLSIPDSDDFDRAEMKTARAVCPLKAVKIVQHQEKKKKQKLSQCKCLFQLKQSTVTKYTNN